MADINDDQRPTILALSITFPVLSTIAVILRFEARRVKRTSLGADDWTILAALIFTLGLTCDVLLDSRLGGLGWHAGFTPEGATVHKDAYKKTTFVLEVLTSLCVGLSKISVLLFYKRIFIGRPFQIIVWCFIGLCIAWTIAFEFALLFSCWPIVYAWHRGLSSKCVDKRSLFMAALSTDVITDGLILLLPIYNVWKLHTRTSQKIAVIAMFLLGGITTVTGIIRLQVLTHAFASLRDSLFNDSIYHSAPAFYWAVIETNTGILSACLPSLRPLLEAYPPAPLLSRLIRPFSIGFQSRTRNSSTDVHRCSEENELNRIQSKALGVHQNSADALSEEFSSRPEIPNDILYQQKYSVSRYDEEMDLDWPRLAP